MKQYNGLYLMANYPDPAAFIRAAGEGMKYFDFLEVGIPFSDPVADGPVISSAAHEMLEKGFKLSALDKSLAEVRKNIPPDKKIYYMTYANIIGRKGVNTFASRSRSAGVSGVIIPDVPFVESDTYKSVLKKHGMEFIHFVTPENSSAQVEEIARSAEGFLYFISVRGITGGMLNLDTDTKKKIRLAKKHSPVPVVLGFGIRDKKSKDEALGNADGFIMGTRVMELLKNGRQKHLPDFFRELFS